MILFSAHAEAALEQRGLSRRWVEQAVADPDWTEPDPADPLVTRSFKRIADCGGRVLRVAHRRRDGDILVITAFLDRGAKP